MHTAWLPYYIIPLSLKGLFLNLIIILLSAGLSIIIYLLISAIISNLSKLSFLQTKLLLKCYLCIVVTLFLLSLTQPVVKSEKARLDLYKTEAETLSGTVDKETNVIVIVIDALRADHLQMYNYQQLTAPHLERVAKDGLIFSNMFSNAAETNPSIASLYSSTYTSTHRVFTCLGESLSEEALTVQEVLQKEGYYTAAFVANPVLERKLGFGQGFSEYDYFLPAYSHAQKLFLFKLAKKAVILPVYFSHDYYVEANVVTERIKEWLPEQKNKFFLYIHYMEPHMPYFAHPDNGFAFSGDSEELGKRIFSREAAIRLYDGEIEYVDKSIGDLISYLKQLGLYKNLLLIVTADHGEELLDHGRYGHGRTLYEEVIKVPLIIKFPKNKKKGVVDNLVSMIDIAPTILDVLNIQVPQKWHGKSLIDIQIPKQDQYVFSEDHSPKDTTSEVRGESFSLRTHFWKLIVSTKRDLQPTEFFDIYADKEETHSLEDKTTEQKQLRELITEIRTSAEKGRYFYKKESFDKETLEHLKSLGYLQ